MTDAIVEASVLHLLEEDRETEPWTIAGLNRWLAVPRRAIEEAVESLRLQGHAIIGDKDGLHLARDSKELAAYIEARRRRLVTVYRGTRALRGTLRRMRESEAKVEPLELPWTA